MAMERESQLPSQVPDTQCRIIKFLVHVAEVLEMVPQSEHNLQPTIDSPTKVLRGKNRTEEQKRRREAALA